MRKQNKPHRRFAKGRKPPQFAQMISTILQDSTVTLEEMMEKAPDKKLDEVSGRIKATYNTLPDDSTAVDSLGGTWVFKDARLFRHLELIAQALREFGDEFYSVEGFSVEGLRYDRKGRTWGDQTTVLGLAYLAIGAGLAEWSQVRDEWIKNEDKLPRIRFLKQEGESHVENEDRSTDSNAH